MQEQYDTNAGRETIRRRYEAMTHSEDSAIRAMATAQLTRLRTSRQSVTSSPLNGSVSAWMHVPIGKLFEAAGNVLVERRSGQIVTGHEPMHGSKSRQCVVIWPSESRWWCSSCGRGGDAVAAVRSLEGVSYPAAVARLGDRYGFARPGGVS